MKYVVQCRTYLNGVGASCASQYKKDKTSKLGLLLFLLVFLLYRQRIHEKFKLLQMY